MPGWSRSFLHPSLVSALQAGFSFEEWLDGRIPGVGYARVSADQSTRSAVLARGRPPGTGVRHQHEENAETAAAFGVAVVVCYEDNGITAVRPDVARPSFLEMVTALHHRRTSEGFPVCALVATEYERVWRLPADFDRLHRALTVTAEGLFIERRAVFDLRAAAPYNGPVSAREEVDRTRERVERHVRRHALDGGTPGGRRRFGRLPPDPRSGRSANMRKDPAEWPVLRRMIEAALGGTAWNDIARWLNSEGVRTAAGNRWSGATVRQALVNPVMCGYRAIRGELVRDPVSGSPVVGGWDAPATVPEWQALVEASRRRGAAHGFRLSNGSPPPGRERRSARRYLFSGVLRCGALRDDGSVCGAKMGGCARPTTRDPSHAVYLCPALDCGGTARRVDAVDAHLTALVLDRLAGRHASVLSDVRRREREWGGTDLLRRLVEQRNAATAPGHDPAESPLHDRIAGLAAARDAHRRSLLAEAAAWDPSRWPVMNLSERRAAIAGVLEAVTVLPLPRGRSRRSAFDPALLRITPAEGAESASP